VAAMSRHRSFNPGASTGAFGQKRSVAPPAQRASREVIGWLAIDRRSRPVAQAACGAQDAFPGA
jgi:hypothetical protein